MKVIEEAREDWGQSLETGSVQVLDAERGTWVCAVRMPSGKRRVALNWHAIRMILTPEEAQAFAEWTLAQHQALCPVEHSESEQIGSRTVTYQEYYEQIRRDSPHMDELHVQINALTAARLEAQLAKRRQQLGGVRLVPAPTASGFVTSLLSNVDTRGRMPATKPVTEEHK